MLRAGICGVKSYYSSAFLSACRGDPQIEVVACAHPLQGSADAASRAHDDAAAWAAQHGLKAYADLEEMVRAERLEVVFVASGDNAKAQHAVTAAAAGCHVFLAKPMCGTLADADAMVAAASRNGVNISPLMPGRYDGAIRSIYNEVKKNGGVGDIVSTRAWIQHGCFAPGTVFDGHPEFGPEQGGIPLSLGFYAADLILWVMEAQPVRAYAEYDNLATPHSIWMDTGKGVVRFDDGRMASMDIIFNVNCGAPPWELEIVGNAGIARAHLDMMEGIVWRAGSKPHVLYRNQNNVINAAVSAFTRSCIDRTTPEVTIEHGRRVLELALAWKHSAEMQQPVTLPLTESVADRAVRG